MRLEGCEIKSMLAIFETKISIDQSKVNLDVKSFGNIIHFIGPESRKTLKKGLFLNIPL